MLPSTSCSTRGSVTRKAGGTLSLRACFSVDWTPTHFVVKRPTRYLLSLWIASDSTAGPCAYPTYNVLSVRVLWSCKFCCDHGLCVYPASIGGDSGRDAVSFSRHSPQMHIAPAGFYLTGSKNSFTSGNPLPTGSETNSSPLGDDKVRI